MVDVEYRAQIGNCTSSQYIRPVNSPATQMRGEVHQLIYVPPRTSQVIGRMINSYCLTLHRVVQ
jgi:hypothetical protein